MFNELHSDANRLESRLEVEIRSSIVRESGAFIVVVIAKTSVQNVT
jgi:hypothetical protein